MKTSLGIRIPAAVALLAACVACEDGLQFGGGTGDSALPEPDPGDVDGLRTFAMMTAFAGDGSSTVVAELAVIRGTGEEARYAGGIRDPYVRVGDSTIELVTSEVSGVFGIDSRRAPQLVYVDGAEYAFGYTVVDSEGSEYDVEAVLASPAERHSAEIAPSTIYYAGEPVDIELFDMANGGALAVVNASTGAVSWGTFRYGGPADLEVAYTSLVGVEGPLLTIPASAFPAPASYRVDVHNYTVARPGDAWLRTTGAVGDGSLFVVGRAFSLTHVAE